MRVGRRRQYAGTLAVAVRRTQKLIALGPPWPETFSHSGDLHQSGISHVHEHLGQLIAYSRMVGMVPPWSAGE